MPGIKLLSISTHLLAFSASFKSAGQRGTPLTINQI